MRQRQRMLKCAVLAALFVLGGACTKINAPAANARQTHEAVMAAASAADKHNNIHHRDHGEYHCCGHDNHNRNYHHNNNDHNHNYDCAGTLRSVY